jgi:hypothetical protein
MKLAGLVAGQSGDQQCASITSNIRSEHENMMKAEEFLSGARNPATRSFLPQEGKPITFDRSRTGQNERSLWSNPDSSTKLRGAMRMQPSSPLYSIITTILLLLIALPLLGFGGRNLWKALASFRWPVTEGKIRTSEVREFVSGAASDRNRTRNYAPSIVYDYRVNGQSYSGEIIYRGQAAGSADASEAEVLHLRYPNGMVVKVHYNPANPADALLEPGIDSDVFWFPGLGMMFLLPCIIYWMVFWRHGLRYQWPFLLGELLAVGLCIGGTTLLASGFHNLKLGWESKKWPTARGSILSSPFEMGDRSPDFVYEFEVSGRKLQGRLVQFGGLSISNYAKDEAFQRRYAVGNEVRVAYCPDDPSLAVLEPGIFSDAWWFPAIGMLLLLVGLGIGIFAIPLMTSDAN